jgi:adenylate cyclase
MTENSTSDIFWHNLLTGNIRKMPIREARHVFSWLGAGTRCKFCNSPFDGGWAPLMRVIGRGPSRLSAHFCHTCQVVATEHLGGTEIELTLLFADVRGSTQFGEQLKPVEFSQLISRFFSVTSQVLMNSGAWVDRLVGDQVIGIYIPYFVNYRQETVAINAARALLDATGHNDPNGPWIKVGIGIHSGTTFIGTVGSQQGATDITVLGDVPNVAARLSSEARSGEILISDEAYTKSKMSFESEPEKRSLTLKGKSKEVIAHVLKQPEVMGS